jgi:hypothetical protein
MAAPHRHSGPGSRGRAGNLGAPALRLKHGRSVRLAWRPRNIPAAHRGRDYGREDGPDRHLDELRVVLCILGSLLWHPDGGPAYEDGIGDGADRTNGAGGDCRGRSRYRRNLPGPWSDRRSQQGGDLHADAWADALPAFAGRAKQDSHRPSTYGGIARGELPHVGGRCRVGHGS